jgi:thymidylate synthase
MMKRILKTLKEKHGQTHEEFQYLYLIEDIIKEGEMIDSRNGKALTIFGSAMHFSLENNNLPMLTTKQVPFKTCLKELLWFLSGKTNNKLLKEQNVHIWDKNGSREFLDSRGLTSLAEDDLGPIYGHQWRHFNASYSDCKSDYTNKGIDQLLYIINCLNDPVERYSRRLIMSAWNPCQIDEMALPPCHILVQFNVINDELSCALYQRSGDVGLGVPFNILSYSILTHLLATHCNLKAKEFVYYLGNAHIYDDHINDLREQTTRTPYTFPTITIKSKHSAIEDYTLEDFEVLNYTYHPKIKMEMRK